MRSPDRRGRSLDIGRSTPVARPTWSLARCRSPERCRLPDRRGHSPDTSRSMRSSDAAARCYRPPDAAVRSIPAVRHDRPTPAARRRPLDPGRSTQHATCRLDETAGVLLWAKNRPYGIILPKASPRGKWCAGKTGAGTVFLAGDPSAAGPVRIRMHPACTPAPLHPLRTRNASGTHADDSSATKPRSSAHRELRIPYSYPVAHRMQSDNRQAIYLPKTIEMKPTRSNRPAEKRAKIRWPAKTRRRNQIPSMPLP